MRRATKATVGVLLVALALAGCGGASSKPANISFKSPALVGGGALPALYTCDGKDISPPLEWGKVPAVNKELAVFILGLTPNGTGNYSISIEWAVAGLNPALHRLGAGQLPVGANVGLASNGKARYSICPQPGQSKQYKFAVYGVPPGVGIPRHFKALELLRVLASPTSTQYGARAGGSFTASYARRVRTGSHRT
jgi:phosphatidylethanolamine-binding protein (PEBP) family uncharacterized protein